MITSVIEYPVFFVRIAKLILLLKCFVDLCLLGM